MAVIWAVILDSWQETHPFNLVNEGLAVYRSKCSMILDSHMFIIHIWTLQVLEHLDNIPMATGTFVHFS